MLNQKLLDDGLAGMRLEVSREQLTRLERYHAELELWNPRYGLVRAAGDELLIRHFFDSLAGLPVIASLTAELAMEHGKRETDERNEAASPGGSTSSAACSVGTARTAGMKPGDSTASGSGSASGSAQPVGPAEMGGPGDGDHSAKAVSICDVGSGAGFPGIPLAIFLPDVSVTLVESSGRRAAFLRNAVSLLSLKNVTIDECRAEDIAVRLRSSAPDGHAFDIVTFRAFRPFDDTILGILSALKTESGWIAAYKGRAEKIRQEMNGLEKKFSETRMVPLRVPYLEEERHLVLFR